MVKELFKKLSIKKYSIDFEPKSIQQHTIRNGSEILCNLCYKDAPTKIMDSVEGSKEVCESCYSLYKLGEEISFRKRYESSLIILNGKEYYPKKLYGNRDWDKINKYIIEMISGHSEIEIDALEAGEIERRNVAIIKMDGNLMGPFIGTSISFTDLYERSARIDLALKKSIFKAIKTIYDSVSTITDDTEAAKQCFATLMGIFYAGGDDSLIALPSWLALPFSWIVGNEFRLRLGNIRGLGIGIAVGNAKANIWSLISASDELKAEAKRYTRNNPSSSSIMFDFAEETTLTGGIVKSRLEYLENEKLTTQPIILGNENDGFKEYVKILFNVSEYGELLRLSYLLSRYSRKELIPESLRNKEDLIVSLCESQRKAKSIRSAIQEVIRVANKTVRIENPNKNYVIIKWFVSKLYAHRQKARSEGKDKEQVYEIIISLSPKLSSKKTVDEFLKENIDRSDNASYLDADRFIKILGGGIL
ncbi:MAG: hypothetical protein H5T50_09965 [Nitrososphaeria archaeon]|nr:hypothetical protein [Nitrososphaeria archaeon]